MVTTEPSHLRPEPGSRHDRRRIRTRRALYSAALELFRQQGFDATTVEQITELADVGKGTFFLHYPTKDHVLVDYWNDFNRRLIEALEGIQKRTTRSRLLTAMEICGKAAECEPAVGRALLARVFVSPALIHSDQENEARLTDWLDRVLEKGVSRGDLREDADVESLRHLLIANLSSTFRDYILSGEGEPAELMSRRTRLLLRGAEAGS